MACNNSKEAKDEFKSVFQDEIKRWQTKCDALTNSVPVKKIMILV